MSRNTVELKDLRYFVAVAEASGIRRAAVQLGAKQSAVSCRLRALEEMLGVSLFERRRDGVRLTFAGKRLLEGVRLTFSHLESTLRSVKVLGEAVEGRLRIGIVASVSHGFLQNLLRRCRQQHADVVVEFSSGSSQENIGSVLARRIDIAFLAGSPLALGCDVEQLWSEPILAAIPVGHPLADRREVVLQDLTDELFIVSRQAPGPEIHNFIVKRLSEIGTSPKINEHGVGRETLLSMVGLGFGVSLVSGAEVGVQYPNVVYVPIVGETLLFSAVWSPKNDNPALRRFLSEARIMAREANGVPSRMPDRSP